MVLDGVAVPRGGLTEPAIDDARLHLVTTGRTAKDGARQAVLHQSLAEIGHYLGRNVGQRVESTEQCRSDMPIVFVASGNGMTGEPVEVVALVLTQP